MNKRPLFSFVPGFFALIIAVSAGAQSQYYWDATSPIMNSPGSGGTGNWSAGTADWWVSGSSDSVWANGNIANFAGTAGTVTLTGAVTANGITFATSGYTISGSSTLTLGGTPTVSLPGGSSAISCVIAGSSGLTVSGSGTLTLSGVNTYTGGTTNGSGCTLSIGGSGKLGSGTYSGPIANAGIFNWSSSASQTLSGVMSGSGMLIQGGGTLTLTAANTYTGATTINSGKTLTLGTGGLLGNGNYSKPITNNGTLNYNNNSGQTLSGVISGSGSVSDVPTVQLNNFLYLTASNTYTGRTTVGNTGQLVISSDSNLGTPPSSLVANQFIFEYGFLKASASFTINSNRGIFLAAGSQGIGASIQVDPTYTLTIAAPISGSAGLGVLFGSGEPEFGAGTNLLASVCTYTGPTGISDGRLLLGTNGALPTGTTLIIAQDDAQGAFFDLGGYTQTIGPLSSTNTFYAPAGVGTGTPTIVLNGTLTIQQTNTATTFNGTITGSGNLNINGNSSGELSLTMANTYTGLTTINGGTLDANGSGSIPTNVVVNGGTLQLDNSTAIASTATLTMASSVTVNLNFSGTQTISALYFGSTPQATGLWGAVGNSSATFTDSRFTGAGLILVCPAPNQTITPEASSVCAGSIATASVINTPGATYSWSINNGTIISGVNSNVLTYSAWAISPVTLNCVATSSCGTQSAGNQNATVTVNTCGPLVHATNVVYDPVNGTTITGTGVQGATWYLNASTNINTPLPWPTIQSGNVSSSPFTVNDPNAPNYPQQFYYLTNQ